MTEEEERYRYLLLRAQAEQAQPQAEPEPPPELEGAEYGEGLAQQLTQGATLGTMDEIVSGGIAGIDKLRQLAGADIPERSFMDVYDETMAAQQMKRKRFERENPGTALAANVAGGLATGGASLAALKGVNALRGAGGLAARMGVGAAEGAAAGYAGADVGKREEGAGFGALLGGAIPGLGTAGRKVLEVASNRRIGQELLDEAGQFSPLTAVSGEGNIGGGDILQNFYQKIVKPSFGGVQLRAQGFEVLDRKMGNVTQAEGALEEITDRAKNIKTDVTEQAEVDLARLRDSALVEADQLKLGTRNQLEGATQATQRATEQAQHQFRQQALSGSFPASTPQVVRQEIAGLPSQQANLRLQDLWSKDGFAEAKAQTYDLDPNVLINDALSGVDSAALSPFKTEIRKTLNAALKGKVDRPMVDPPTKFVTAPGTTTGAAKKARRRRPTSGVGTVSGENLMQARNELKMAASRLGEDGKPALNAGALKKSADSIDDFIRKNLPDDAARGRWDAEFEAYGQGKTYQRATESATLKRQGDFTEDDWIGATKKFSTTGAGRGQGRLQGQAATMQVDGVERSRALKDQKKQISRQAEEAGIAATLARNAESDRLRGLKKTGGPEYDAALSEKAAAKGAVAEASADFQETAKLITPGSNPAAFQAAYTSKLLAKPFRALVPGKPNPGLDIFTGLAGGLALGTETAQRTLAGQTGIQKRLAEALRKKPESEIEKYIRSLGRGIGRGVTTFNY